MSNYVIFRDNRGVIYCEEEDNGIDIYTMVSPAEYRRRRGSLRKIQTKSEELKFHLKFDPAHYDPDIFHSGAFQGPPPGYTRNYNWAYMKPNFWGPVKIIHRFEPAFNDVAKKIHEEFRLMSPEKGTLTKETISRNPDPSTCELAEDMLSDILWTMDLYEDY